MSSEQHRFLLATGGVCALGMIIVAGYGGGQEAFVPGLASTGQLTLEECQVDTSPETMVLSLRWLGGSNFHAPQYRLFGDGRLLREIVPKLQPDTPLRVDEVQLSPNDMDLIIRTIVEGRIAAMTAESLRNSMGGKDFADSIIDAGTAMLSVRFFSCDSNTGPIVPYSNTVSVTAPEYQAERFPESRELQSFVVLIDALEAYFPEPVALMKGESHER